MKARRDLFPLVFIFGVFTALVAALAQPAFARLGESESTVAADSASLHGTHKIASRSLFRVHEITGTAQTVREYATNDGTIFAVTWKGIGAPNLARLFGAYYQEYQDADAATPRPKGRAPKVFRSSNLVVHRFGHMGDVQGKVYIPALMPNGVTVKDLR